MKMFKSKLSAAGGILLMVVGILIGTQIQNVFSGDNIYQQTGKIQRCHQSCG